MCRAVGDDRACSPRPGGLQQGGGICRVCAGCNSASAEAAFLARVAELGATLAPGAAYRDTNTRVPVICAQGHACNPRPAGLQRGGGVCRICAGNYSGAGEAVFLARVAEIGAMLAPGAAYCGSGAKVPLICAQGHSCNPSPGSVQQGAGVCRVCAGNDPASAEGGFLARVAELGAALAPGGAYRRNNTPVPLICAQGHACSPQPTNVIQGHGICGECIASFDRVYLLRHPSQRPSRWVLPVAVVVYAAMWGAATRS
jgi:hypothetical protein